MRRLTVLAAAALFLFSLSAFGADVTVVKTNSQGFGSVAAGTVVALTGERAVYHRIYWYPIGTVSTCQVKLEQSADGSSGFSDLIAAQTCTSAGVSAYTSGSANFVRPNVTTLSGGGAVFVVYEGFNGDPAGITTSNASTNLAQVAGTNTVTGGANGTLGIGGVVANDAPSTGNPILDGGLATADAASPTSVSTAGDLVALRASLQGRLMVMTDHPNRFHCTAINQSATTLTAFGAPCAAPGAGLSLYITSITASASVIATTTADQFLEIKSGTGGTCGTGTAVVWAAYNLAFAPTTATFPTPIRVGTITELCWMHAATGSKTFIVDGYIAP
jgi:hypothetical protein